MELDLTFPKKFKAFDTPMRYKVARGGRGSAKSWSFARKSLVKAVSKPTRFLCAREVQNSIKESVHKLITNQIDMCGLSKLFNITRDSITCANGSEYIFKGIKNDPRQIKSLENIDICWLSEAAGISEESMEILTATIRNDDSEIWVDFNPEYEDDYVYQFFVVSPPDNCINVEMNYMDNPWFPAVLEKERQQDHARLDKDSYENKWLGKPKGTGRKVWAVFDKKHHIKIFPKELIAKEGNCFMGMDPHSHYYPFCVWVAIIPKNKRHRWPEDFYKHVYAEWPTYEDLGGYYYEMRKKVLYQGTLADMAKEIYAKDGIENGIKIYNRYIDTRFAKGSGSWNWSTKTEGIVIEFAKKENGGLLFRTPLERIMDAQKDIIRRDMEWNKFAEISDFNEPTFSVDPSCKNTIISLQNHRLEEGSEKESEKYKEPSDVIRIIWAGLSGFKYEDPNPKPEDSANLCPQPRSGSWMA